MTHVELIKDIIGLKVNKAEILTLSESDAIRLTCANGSIFDFYHPQSCCEDVYIQDIAGDLQDLCGIITRCELVSNVPNAPVDKYDDSYTWTYLKIDSNLGGVTVRFYGSSNGYYSEDIYCRVHMGDEDEDEYDYQI